MLATQIGGEKERGNAKVGDGKLQKLPLLDLKILLADCKVR